MNQATSSIFNHQLGQTPANYTPLSPLTFIERSASVYPDRTAVIHGAIRRNWAQTYERCRRLASALKKRGIGKDDTVSVMLPNIPEMLEAHFGIPMAGAVLSALNTRLDASSVAFMLQHSESKALIVDREFGAVVREALSQVTQEILVVDVDDPEYGEGEPLSDLDYEALIAEGDPDFHWKGPDDEWDAITLNYTSGTTGNPKGVVYHHRGAYLNSIGNTMIWNMGEHPIYLWTLPMFHCNGWCFPWGITACAGTHVCLRKVEPKKILDLIREVGVTHMCSAPIVLNGLLYAPDELKQGIDHEINVMTAGAPPQSQLISGIEAMGFRLTHVYGLTEVYGPVTVCSWHEEWDELPVTERARLKSRQGVRYPTLEGVMVADSDTLAPVPNDATTMGEIFMRGNTVMKGYLKNPDATDKAFEGGWYHTGDLAVLHPDGYVEIKDRIKDVIISGGENISTVEVENVVYSHPAVVEVAVVARPDEKWGETPCAFVTLQAGKEDVTEEDIMDYCRDNMARFKVPKKIVFCDLPKSATGKIQKFVLRDQAKEV